MKIQRNSGRSFEIFRAVCVVAALVGLISLLVSGQAGLAWGLGWGLPVGTAWALILGPRLGIIQGISAGLYTGVGLGGFTFGLGELGILLLRGLFWGLLAGLATAFALRGVKTRLGELLVGHFAAALTLGVVGMLRVGVIGEVLEGFSLSGAGFVIGTLLMCPLWALCSTAGVILGRLLFKMRSSELDV